MEAMLLRPRDVAKALSLGQSKTYALIAAGVLPSIRLGGVIRVPVESLRAWIAEQGQQAKSAQV
jgi:excisionase family DNA binding protein